MSVVQLVRPKTLLVAMSAAVMVAGTIVGANIAQADSVWVQSYQRASQTEACVSQPNETPVQEASGSDSSWSPSWEMWANGGAGGWTCTRNITWAITPEPAASGGGGGTATYRLGDIGPGGGLVFLIDNGVRYEMAPWSWGGSPGNENAGVNFCQNTAGYPMVTSFAVGSGAANTATMAATTGCASSAVAAVRAYAGGGKTDWFIPSYDELNALCNYIHDPTSPAAPSVPCSGPLDPSFASGSQSSNPYTLVNFGYYWTSSANPPYEAWIFTSDNGFRFNGSMNSGATAVRPIRMF